MGESGQRAGGPIAAGNLGDREERPPVVGQTVEGAWWQRRIASGNGGEIIFGPASELPGENDFDFNVHRVEAGRDLSFLGFDQRNEDGAVTQRGGKGDKGGGGGGAGRDKGRGRLAVPLQQDKEGAARWCGA